MEGCCCICGCCCCCCCCWRLVLLLLWLWFDCDCCCCCCCWWWCLFCFIERRSMSATTFSIFSCVIFCRISRGVFSKLAGSSFHRVFWKAAWFLCTATIDIITGLSSLRALGNTFVIKGLYFRWSQQLCQLWSNPGVLGAIVLVSVCSPDLIIVTLLPRRNRHAAHGITKPVFNFLPNQ